MKNIYLLVLIAFGINASAQQTILFQENFDLPSGPDSVNVSSSSGTNPVLWNDTSILSVSPTQCFHLQGSTNASVSFESQSFSTLNANQVHLRFNHIAKVSVFNQCKIYVSNDNGLTWTVLNTSHYNGSSVGTSNGFANFGYFNDGGYIFPVNAWNYGVWSGPGSVPNNNWWVTEYFDISSIAKNSQTGLGYPQVKVRFEGNFTSPPQGLSSFAHGWFVDDVDIVSSNCNIAAPRISVRTGAPGGGAAVCRDSLISGAYHEALTFNQLRDFRVVGASGIDSVRLVQIVNEVRRASTSLPSQPSGIYSFTFTNYLVGDTVDWAIEAYDNCSNITRYPSFGYHRFWFISPPSKCQGGPCQTAHKIINTFPWKEDFEGSGWSTGGGNNGGNRGTFPENLFYEFNPSLTSSSNGWSVRTGSTVTANTGPNGDHSTGTGNYLYTEFTNIFGSSEATFTLPCIDITDSAHLVMSFYYHMYGMDIDKLRIDIDTTPGTTPTWDIHLKILREHQNSSLSPWKKATISLEPYRGKTLKLRFLGRGFGFNKGIADIAIDDIEIIKASPKDVALIDITSPNLDPCSGSSSLPVTIDLVNNGFEALPLIPVAFQLDNGTVVRDTIINTTAGLIDTLNFTFSQSLTYNPALPHTFKVWSELSGDADVSTDTIALVIPVLSDRIINTFPYFENFEKATTSPTGIGSINTSKWDVSPYDTSSPSWAVVSGKLSNTIYGPPAAFGKNKQALALKAASGGALDSAYLISGCVDLTNISNGQLSFQYLSNYSNQLQVLIKEGIQPWTVVSTPSAVLNLDKERMQGFQVNLSAYSGKTIQIAFRAPQNWDYSCVIDDILIYPKPNIDLALRDVELDRLFEGQAVYSTSKVHFTNWGNSAVNLNYYSKLRVQLVDKCNPSAPSILGESDSIFLQSTSIGLNGSLTFPNLQFSQTIPPGEYTAKYWLETVGDQFHDNDTAFVDVVCQGAVTLPYFNDFESCATGAYVRGRNNQWEIGVPQKPGFTSAHSGNKAAITNADTNTIIPYATGLEVLELPGMIGLDTLYDAELRLWQNFDFGSSNIKFGVAQILDGPNFRDLYNPSISGTNWRNLWTSVNDPAFSVGISGSSNGWVYSSYPLSEFKAPGLKYIRFVTFASDVPGWAIDDVEIHIPPQNSGSPKFLSFTNNIPATGNNPIDIKIQNTGAAPLNEVDLVIEENGSILIQEKIVFATPILKGNFRTVALTQPLPLNSSMQELLVYTLKPNSRLDAIPLDDTMKLALQFLVDVDSIPHCFGFENSSSFLAFDPNLGAFDTTWVKGSPNKAQINTAHTGSEAWFTSKSSNYGGLLNQFLYTPIYEVSDNSCYRFSFWQNFDTENNFDGGNVEFTLDSGLTWQTLGYYWSTDSLWYNTQFVQSLDYVKPGFSGNSGGWTLAQNDFRVFGNPAAIQFRFRFASNASITGEGWAIDDVCLEPIGSNCETIGMETHSIQKAPAYLYPIPSSSNVELRADLKGVFELTIHDQRGAIVKKWSAELSPDQITPISIDKLAAGVYWLQIETTSEPVILKFIKD